MPITAKFYVSVNGGANEDLGVEVPSAATIEFIPESTAGWLRARWEIYDYPEGWSTPAGWSLDGSTGTIYYEGILPPDVTLPSSATIWGVWMLRVLVNEQLDDDQNILEGLFDDTTALSMLSPSGYRDMGARENSHFTTATTRIKNWIRSYQRNLRLVEQFTSVLVGPTITNTGTGTLSDIVSTSGGSNAAVIVFTGAGSKVLTGLASPAQSRVVMIKAAGSGTLTIAHETTSTAANRTVTQLGGNVVLANGASGFLVYNNVSNRWEFVGVTSDFGAQNITTTGTVTAASAALTTHFSVGSNAASTGEGRFANASTLTWRNAANSLNFVGLRIDGSNVLYLGDLVSGYTYWQLSQAASQAKLHVWNGSSYANQVEYDGSLGYMGVPRIGNSTPYASEGRATQAMADTNQTLGASIYSRRQVKLTGTHTAVRTATFPHPASENASYSKCVENACTAFNTIISTGTGTTVEMIPGQSLTLDFSPSGVKSGVADGDPEINGFRLTGTTATPVGDTTNASTLYFTPYLSGAIALYDGSSWVRRVSAEVSLALSGLTSGKNYDVFVNWSGSALVLTLVVWTNDSTRATSLATQDGVYVQSGDATKRYVGTIRTTGTNQTQDSTSQRFIWNFYNRVRRPMSVTEATSTWNFATTINVWRQVRSTSSNKVEYVCGDPVVLEAVAHVHGRGDATGVVMATGVGIDSTTVNSAVVYGRAITATTTWGLATAHYEGVPARGYHAINWLEVSNWGPAGTMTFASDSASTSTAKSGMLATISG